MKVVVIKDFNAIEGVDEYTAIDMFKIFEKENEWCEDMDVDYKIFIDEEVVEEMSVKDSNYVNSFQFLSFDYYMLPYSNFVEY